MSSGATASTSNEKPDVTIVTEVPPSLHKALLLVVKNFFSPEHYIIVYYIMRAVCIREENLRGKIQFDQRQLRQQLATLKAEKLVKERLLSQKNENGRSVSIIFYYINYRAIINVLKYKIDHMRQKLEAKEKEDVQKAIYRCEGCGSQYETLDIDRIIDHMTGGLKCWRCQGVVTQDDSGGPTQTTRSLLARFNEQMLPLFAAIRELAGIQLAPHLLEPDINQFLAEEDKTEQQQLVDFSNPDRGSLGGKAYAAHRGANTIRYQEGDSITVDLNADINSKPMEEAKQVPLWLQDDAIAGSTEHAQAAAALAAETSLGRDDTKPSTSKTIDMLVKLEGESEQPPAKMVKLEETEDGQVIKRELDESEGEEGSDEEEEETVDVQGQKIPLSEVTPEMVESMTDDERQRYVTLVQEQMDY